MSDTNGINGIYKYSYLKGIKLGARYFKSLNHLKEVFTSGETSHDT